MGLQSTSDGKDKQVRLCTAKLLTIGIAWAVFLGVFTVVLKMMILRSCGVEPAKDSQLMNKPPRRLGMRATDTLGLTFSLGFSVEILFLNATGINIGVTNTQNYTKVNMLSYLLS